MRCSLAAGALMLSALAGAQIEPLRPYNGINKPLEARVREGGTLLLLEGGSGREIARGSAVRGTVRLDVLFPDLRTRPGFYYVQLEQEGKRKGTALALQPMTNPPLSRLRPDGRTVEFVPDDEPAFAGFRAWRDQHLILETTFGPIEFRLRPDAAPNTTWIIMELVRGGFYRDIPWHRIVAKRPVEGTPFVIQAGDPTGTGNGGPGFAYALEDSKLAHTFGVISVARSTDPNTNGSQIFVCLSRAGTQHLDHRYAAFGEAIRGAEVILRLAAVPVGPQDRPKEMPYIKSARLVPAAPYGSTRPLERPE
jgi:peptidyl-prolyl cis-trans isomerase B (cyclophilin B)